MEFEIKTHARNKIICYGYSAWIFRLGKIRKQKLINMKEI